MRRFLLALALVAPACIDGEGTPDARVYQDDQDGDTTTNPGFRDAGCSGGATSGSSGEGCRGDGGLGGGDIDASVPDAAVPDAAPPCDEVTFFHQSDFDLQSLWVTGTFTQPEWAEHPDDGALVLEHLGDGAWELTARVGDPPAETGYHEYKFISDGEHYFHDPDIESVPDGFGGQNNVLYVCE
jgi:hypothetical protein